MEQSWLLIIQGVSTIATIFGVFILNSFGGELRALKNTASELKDTTSELNTNIAVLIRNDEHKEEKIRDNKVSISRLYDEQKRLRDKMHDITNEITKVELIKLKVNDLVNKQAG